MKLLLSLILIISIALCNANAYKMYNQKPIDHEKIKSDGQQTCFLSGTLSSYSGTYILTSYNRNILTQQGLAQESFYEQGYIDFDFENNQLFTSYKIDISGEISNGAIWAFANNNTEYVVLNVNGETVCYAQQLTVPIPTQYKLSYVGDIYFGTLDTEMFVVQTPSNITQDTLLVSKVDCSAMSVVTENVGTVQGNSVQNIFNYQPSNPSDFYVPAECFTNPTPSSNAHAQKLRKSMKLPTIFKH